MRKFNFPLTSLVTLGALAAFSRLPQLLGGYLYPDSDECVIGLMALRWLRQGEFPAFFWGQGYGLATLEAGLVAAGYRVLGYGPLALKASMLVLWVLGVWVLGLAIRRFSGRRAAWVCLLLMIACPAWAGWSMKARGGYLTAFLFFNTILWLVGAMRSHVPTARRERVFFGVLGLLAVLTALAQPVWALPMMPFLALALAGAKGRRAALAGWFALGAGLPLCLYGWWLTRRPPTWLAPMNDRDVLTNLSHLPEKIGQHLTGAYFLSFPMPVTFWASLSGGLWYLLLIVGVVLALHGALRRRVYGPSQAAVLAVLAACAYTLPLNRYYNGARFLLPLTGLLLIMIGDYFSQAWRAGRAPRWLVLAPIALLGVVGARNLADWRMPLNQYDRLLVQVQQSDALAARDALLARGIRDVYCLDFMQQYVLMFAAKEEILARATAITAERQTFYPLAVEQARLTGRPTALFGNVAQRQAVLEAARSRGLALNGLVSTSPYFFILPNPPAPLLQALKFELAPSAPANRARF